MATIKDITTLCKSGQIQEAYDLAQADLAQDHNNLWAQREMGWALYYKLRAATNCQDYQEIVSVIDEFTTLDRLSLPGDSIMLEQVMQSIGWFVIKNNIDATAMLSTFFGYLESFTIQPSEGYSIMLQAYCKSGQIQKAYELAKTNQSEYPNDPWAQREVGWIICYKMETATNGKDYQGMVSYLDEFIKLDMLSVPDDNNIFENILFKVASYIHSNLISTDIETPAKLSTFFSRLRGFTFPPSDGYSFLLSSFLKKGKSWPEMADFLDWWNLDNLTGKDYKPFITDEGFRIMALAEQAYISNSKALLSLNDPARIEAFLPKLNALMEAHPEMTYPGYFYGKLLVSLGENPNEALRVVVPFVCKKHTEFWAWQLMSDVLPTNDEKKVACLLRAVNCRTQEKYLGKVRIKLASFFIQHNDLNRARYQIDTIVRCYAMQGWHLPFEIEQWIHEPWINNATPDKSAPIDFMKITDELLSQGTEEAVAIATFFNYQSRETTLVYGFKKVLTQVLRFKAIIGETYQIHYLIGKNGSPKIVYANSIKLPDNLNYAKIVVGIVSKRQDAAFARLLTETEKAFIPPVLVKEHNLEDGQTITGKIVYCFNTKKGVWNWDCVTIMKQKN